MREIDPARLGAELPQESTVKNGKPPGSFEEAKLKWQKRLNGRLKYDLFRAEPNGDRSKRIYAMAAQLLEHGVSPNDAWWLIYGSRWGQSKYKRRPQEVTRIITKLKGNLNSRPRTPRREKAGVGEWENLYELLGQDIPAPQWLIENVWGENNYGMMAGQAKVHKTWLALDMAISISSGKPFLDQFEVKGTGPAMVIEAEVRRHSMRFRSNLIAEAKGIHATVTDGVLEVPHIYPVFLRRDTHMDLTDPDQMGTIEREVKVKRPKLMILDPLQFMLGGGDENQARDVRRALLPLSEMALTYDCAVVVVHHFKKNTDEITRGGEKASGSQAFHAWGESNLWVEYEADNAVKIEREFRDHDSPGEMEVIFEIGPDHYLPWVEEYDPQLKSGKKDGEKKKNRRDTSLIDFVTANPNYTIPELAKEIGKAEKTIRIMIEKHPDLRLVSLRRKGFSGRPRKVVRKIIPKS